MAKYKNNTRYGKVEVTGSPVVGGDIRPDFVGSKVNAAIDNRSNVALVRLGDSVALLEPEDYRELTDAPVRVV